MKHATYNKNRNRAFPSFVNINLLGTCNANCYFCLGKDILNLLKGKDQLSVHYDEWKNFDSFLMECQEAGICKLYITGQTADGLQYDYLPQLVDHLQEDLNFHVGVRTNGYLALEKIDVIQKMKEEIGYSIQSLNPETNQKIMGRSDIPDWNAIIPLSGDHVRVSIVVNRYNIEEIEEIIHFCSQFENIRYIQLRRISTDTRLKSLQYDLDLFEELFEIYQKGLDKKNDYYLAQCYQLFGKDVIFWRTVETSCNSWNYFTDGTFSKEYFIIEGYINNYEGRTL